MKAVLHETDLVCYTKRNEQTKQIELVEESVVSDRMPDIGLLGGTNANVVLRVKKAEDGIGILAGDLIATVCYIPDGSESFQSVEITIPWEAEFESENITTQTILIGDVSIGNVDVRMMNPRKVQVKLQLNVRLLAFEKEDLILHHDMDENPAIQVRKEIKDYSVISAVTEKTFAVSDEWPLSEEYYGGSILSKSVQLRVDDVKTIANKLIVKGSVLSDVVISTDKRAGERISFTSGFSFIAETESETVTADVVTALLPTGVFYEISADGRAITMEVHGVCQMMCYEKRELAYISDSYSNFYKCELQYRPLSVFTENKNVLHRENIVTTVNGRSQLAKVVFTNAQIHSVVKKDSTSQIHITLGACVLYENGTNDWLKKSFTVDVKQSENEYITAVRIGDIYAVVNGTELEVRMSLDIESRKEVNAMFNCVSEIGYDETSSYCMLRPSISVVRYTGALWELAKNYGSTVELIQLYNQLEDNILEEERMLLIPKQSL